MFGTMFNCGSTAGTISSAVGLIHTGVMVVEAVVEVTVEGSVDGALVEVVEDRSNGRFEGGFLSEGTPARTVTTGLYAKEEYKFRLRNHFICSHDESKYLPSTFRHRSFLRMS